MKNETNPEVSQLVTVLRDYIREKGALPPERTLAEQLNVKRHRLREALQMLKKVGEVPESGTQRRGNLLSRRAAALARDTNPIEVFEVRLAIEPMLARLAALRATPTDIARIQDAATTMSNLESGSTDLAFHKLIAAASHNTLAAELYTLLRQVGTDARLRVEVGKPREVNRVVQRDSEHHAIADAIARRDPAKAEEAMRAHLNMVHRQILDRLS